jgi:hypothetical protein
MLGVVALGIAMLIRLATGHFRRRNHKPGTSGDVAG